VKVIEHISQLSRVLWTLCEANDLYLAR